MPQRRGRWAGYGDYRGARNTRRSRSIRPPTCMQSLDGSELHLCGRPALAATLPPRCADHIARVRFEQSDEWHRAFEGQLTGSVYADDRCCYCYRPTRAVAKRIMLTRTNDGEWWAVHPLASVRDDERHMGDPHFALPIGPDCLRAHPEFRFAIVGTATGDRVR